MRIDPSNTDQHQSWNGTGGSFWAEHAERMDAGVADYQPILLDAAAIEPTDHVLDIGCGSGQTTRDAARLASGGTALGIDLSGPMLDHARHLAAGEGLTNVTFEQADAQLHPFPSAHFDVAVSRNGAMLFGDPVAAFTNIAGALRPGARLALLNWQPVERNEWFRAVWAALDIGRDLPMPPPDKPGPFAFSDPDRVRTVLTSAGFTDVTLTGHTGTMYFGPDPDDACRHVIGQFHWLTADLSDADRTLATETLRADLTRHHTADGVRYVSSAWIIRASRP